MNLFDLILDMQNVDWWWSDGQQHSGALGSVRISAPWQCPGDELAPLQVPTDWATAAPGIVTELFFGPASVFHLNSHLDVAHLVIVQIRPWEGKFLTMRSTIQKCLYMLDLDCHKQNMLMWQNLYGDKMTQYLLAVISSFWSRPCAERSVRISTVRHWH